MHVYNIEQTLFITFPDFAALKKIKNLRTMLILRVFHGAGDAT